MADFVIKRGDTRPALAAQLTDNATPIDLTAATSVKLIMRAQGSQTVTVNTACTFVNRATGQVLYQWTGANTSTVGIYDIEFQITWNDSTIETVPNDAPTPGGSPYYTVEIKADIAD